MNDRFPSVPIHLIQEFAVAPLYKKKTLVRAIATSSAGFLDTPEGLMTYRAGDYLVCDDPFTHAWPVVKEVFESTYELAED